MEKSAESYALASLFYALSYPSDDAWKSCGDAMRRIPNTQINVGFSAQSSSLAQQADVQYYDLAIAGKLDIESKDATRAVAARDLAQKYMGLIGNDLSIWKLRKQEMDPQRRAYYLLGLASLIEANSVADSDPKKSCRRTIGLGPTILRVVPRRVRHLPPLLPGRKFATQDCSRDFVGKRHPGVSSAYDYPVEIDHSQV